MRYATNLTAGESFIHISNDGANGAPLLGPGFGTKVGNICVNVYTLAPDEQLVSCCSCLVTPNGLLNLAVKRDLTSNTPTPDMDKAVIKLVSTLAGTNGSGTTCNNSAAQLSQGVRVPGLTAWGTTLQPLPAGFGSTETPFTPATLSDSEAASLGARCAKILGNSSGFGLCRVCDGGNGCNLAASCPSLSNLIVGAAVTVPIPITGGTPPYTCTLASGNLPAGMTLSGCSITGTPTDLGYNFSIAVTDSSSPACAVTINCSFTPNPPPLDPDCQSFCAARGSTITPVPTIAIGGTPPYSYTTTGLPAALTISSTTGFISGTVTAPAGVYPYRTTVTDSGVPPQSVTTDICTVTVTEPPTASCPTLMYRRGPPMTGFPIIPAIVPISGGIAPYTCSATGLPPDLTISPTTCTISGTVNLTYDQCIVHPTYDYTIKITDSSTGACAASTSINCSVTLVCDP